DVVLVRVGLRGDVVQHGSNVLGLLAAVAFYVAAGVDVVSGRVREALAHRHHDDVAALHEIACGHERAIAALMARIAERLAVIDHNDGKRTGAGGLEDRGFELGGKENPFLGDRQKRFVQGRVDFLSPRCGPDEEGDYARAQGAGYGADRDWRRAGRIRRSGHWASFPV